MNNFFRTDKQGKGRASHYHVMFYDGKTALLSTDKDHTHQLDLSAGKPSILEANGHTHMMGDPVPNDQRKDKETDEEIVGEVRNLFKDAYENESDYRKRAEESEGFYSGDGQWEKQTKDYLQAEERAALTINEIEPKMDILSGHQRQNRLDIKFFPVEEGDQTTADILNILAKNVFEQCGFDSEETDSFDDQMITGRGNINCRVDYEKNHQGDIIFEWWPWDQITYGPHRRKDIGDCEYLFKHQLHSKSYLQAMYSDKADQITAEYDEIFIGGDSHATTTKDQYEASNNEPISVPLDKKDPVLVDLYHKKFRLIECWRKTQKSTPVIVHVSNDIYENADNWNERDLSSIKTLQGFSIVKIKKSKMRKTTFISSVLLDDEFPDLAMQDFHVTPIYAKKRNKRVWGKVESVKDVQREVNKRHSQAIDILNKVASYGWFYDAETFVDKKEETKFKETSSIPGFLSKVQTVDKRPVQVEGVKFPNELANYEALASNKMKEIMNINLEMLGMPSGADSGIAIIRRQRQGLIGNEFLFDNLSLAKKKIARLLCAYIQKVYDVDRMIRILENRATRGEVLEPRNVPEQSPYAAMMKQTQTGPKYDPEVLKELLTNMDLTKYDVAVGESAYSPTNRQANFILWMEAAKGGIPVPPTMLVDLSDLPDKEKVKQAITQMMMEQKQEADKTRQTELVKAGIDPGTGVKMPEPGGQSATS